MKTICVLTATRAEYGLLRSVIFELKKEYKVNIVVTGMHLSPEFGFTYKEIEEDNLRIDKKIEILLSSDTNIGVSKAMGLALISFSEYFEESKPDAVLLLGDRFETLAVAIAAMNSKIPIIHMYGGEKTEGALDEAIRHSITKMSNLHFTSTEDYRKRVIQLGENPKTVFNVGATGVENILKETLMTKNELEKSLDLILNKPYVLVTFHPVTLEEDSAKKQISDLMELCEENNDFIYIVTKANADKDGRIINNVIDKFSEKNKHIFSFYSLGMKRYLSAIKYCEYVLGNSSSGIIEVPSLKKPTINIGDRQKGRVRAESILDCSANKNEIKRAIEKLKDKEYIYKLMNTKNPYENGESSKKIFIHINEFMKKKITLKKEFYDCEIKE